MMLSVATTHLISRSKLSTSHHHHQVHQLFPEYKQETTDEDRITQTDKIFEVVTINDITASDAASPPVH